MIDPRPLLLSVGLALVLGGTLPPAAIAATELQELEGVGADMGYRMYGETRKNKPLLLQNSRPHAVQVFDDKKGMFVSIPPFSDRDFPCEGKARLLHVRFSDAFGERAPFRVSIGCGRELQFISQEQVSRPVPVPEAPLAEPDVVIEPLADPAAPAPAPTTAP